MSKDGGTLYWTVTTGDALHAVSTEKLKDASIPAANLSASVKTVARLDFGTDGIMVADDSAVLITDVAYNGVTRVTPATGATRLTVASEGVFWPEHRDPGRGELRLLYLEQCQQSFRRHCEAGRRTVQHLALSAFGPLSDYPAIAIDASCLYVDEGDILTSAGSSAGIDLCLHIVRSDFGVELANTVARRLVMYSHRQGGQSRFIERRVPLRREVDRLSSILGQILAQLQHPHTISSLARKAGTSERTFQHRFRSLTGLPSLQWILRERLEQARVSLETRPATPDDIARETGLGSAENLRF
ncbi:helix-turn-helix domain-containing protein [Agrobacterium tumefaciens]|uniref:helix-turn-helix domain-containing protein n=1 Tax=Agrobacterium tumefaciens TaxID=358 RepID=UPI001E53D30F|nr:helix-turn-helix domain-containing protein [Agrobacterium tumefaciens]